MAASIYQGSAPTDGANFNGWFVDDLQKWCAENGVDYNPDHMTLRDTTELEIKWGRHPKGQQRPGGWAGPTDKICLSLLLHGSFVVRFRPPGDQAEESAYHLQGEGDYLLWREEVEHTWQAEEDSLVLTIRWKAGESAL